jgi:hypothetical protein
MGILSPSDWTNAMSPGNQGQSWEYWLANAAQQDATRAQQAKADEAQAPWLKAGTQAVNMLGQGTQPGGYFNQTYSPSQFTNDPSYQWRLKQGADALSAQGSAAGMTGSGNLARGITDYAQNAAAQEYQAGYSRFNQTQNQQYNQLAGLSGTGQVAGSQLNNLGAAGVMQGNSVLANYMAGLQGLNNQQNLNASQNANQSQSNLSNGLVNALPGVYNYFAGAGAAGSGLGALGSGVGGTGVYSGTAGLTGALGDAFAGSAASSMTGAGAGAVGGSAADFAWLAL